MSKKTISFISTILVLLLGVFFGKDYVKDIPFLEDFTETSTSKVETSVKTKKENVASSEEIDILDNDEDSEGVLTYEMLPQWNGTQDGMTITINDNHANFQNISLEPYTKTVKVKNEDGTETDKVVEWGWAKFSPLDDVKGEYDKTGRAHRADALLNKNILPTKDRGDISTVSPTGWNSYGKNSKGKDGVNGWNSIKGFQKINGKKQMFYNRGHLLGNQLTGINAEERNLITMARICNAPVMVKYENQLKKYLETTDDSVRYQVTPIYNGNEKVARAVQLRAESLENDENGNSKLDFNVVIFNVNPEFTINYETGEFTAN